ncbi:MAG: dethiobiotin synthase [Solirubrobacterales bacterium]
MRVPLNGRGLFVTGTDTDVGKTVVACAIAATLAARGQLVSVFKPVVTGLAEGLDGPPDHERLRASARSPQSPAGVAPYRFDPPVSPHLAAQRAGVTLKPHHLRTAAHAAGAAGEVLVAEGVGGLMVPLAGDYLVRDLAADLGLPVVVVARPGLGTISHTLMTIECARAVGLEVKAVVLTPWPREPTAMHRSNRETISRLAGVEVATLRALDVKRLALDPQPQLPVERWVAAPAPSHLVAV